jgi:signal transduction histidine kinase
MQSRSNFNSRALTDRPLTNDTTDDARARLSRVHKNERVIIIAPVGQDAAAMATLLDSQGFETQICKGAAEYSRQIADCAGALLLTEEALESAQSSVLLDVLKTQPPWSELPLIILTSGGESRRAGLLNLAAAAAGTVTLLERPISTGTLIRSVQVALRSRRRQYQVRDLVSQLATLNETLEHRVSERTRELRTANKELKREIERRKGIEGQILEISDREQQRLGQELHDGLCQHLTAVAFMARSVALRLKNHRVIDASDIEKIAQLVNNAATDTRNLSRALHRLDVDAPGLVAALEDLVDREIWKTPCRLEIKPSFHIEDDVAAAQFYRIAREAVINANKHAQAREIVIKLERSRQGMVLRVIDDGVGFSYEPNLNPGLGYHIMNYRAGLIGGRLEIDSPKHGGTRVSCYLSDPAPGSPKFRAKENGGAAASLAKSQKMPAPRDVNFSHLTDRPAANH